MGTLIPIALELNIVVKKSQLGLNAPLVVPWWV
jgi:hypothetical protein